MNIRSKYRGTVFVLFFLSVLPLGWCTVEVIRSKIPDSIQISEIETLPRVFHNSLDAVIRTKYAGEGGGDGADRSAEGKTADSGEGAAKQSALSRSAGEKTTYMVAYSLFGAIPLKMVSVSVVPRSRLYAGGSPIGIYLETDGVLVVDTGEITSGDGKSSCPAKNIVKTGDYIQSVNGEPVSTKEELIACIADSEGLDVILDVERAGERISLRIKPVLDSSGAYRAGIWVRNDTQGIGTLTYMDEAGRFGALGHGISDIDTGELLDVSGGTLYDADVISVIKGQQGVPGELSGIIHYSEGYKIGNIEKNSSNGIFGKVSNLPALAQDKKLYMTAHKQEVKQGKATILCSVGGECREYEVEIREIRMNGSDVNKGMILEVTDGQLLEKTGGIVQGMSGSPIIQDGKIVGAVTHVLVNDPTRGYGIFIENMLEATE